MIMDDRITTHRVLRRGMLALALTTLLALPAWSAGEEAGLQQTEPVAPSKVRKAPTVKEQKKVRTASAQELPLRIEVSDSGKIITDEKTLGRLLAGKPENAKEHHKTVWIISSKLEGDTIKALVRACKQAGLNVELKLKGMQAHTKVATGRAASKKTEEQFITTYAVADLVVSKASLPAGPDGMNSILLDPKERARKIPKGDFEPLIKLIILKVRPTSWKSEGGSGTVEPFSTTLSLVVRQTREGHQEIAELLSRWRKQSYAVDDLAKLLKKSPQGRETE